MDETHILERGCHTCGNIGYEEVISTCVKCGTREHVYCMRVSGKVVPQNWVCEECTLCETTVLQECRREEHIQNSSHEGSHDKVTPRGSSQACHDSGMRNASTKAKAGKVSKVMFLASEEVVRLESGAKRNEPRKMGNQRGRFCDASFNSRTSRLTRVVSSPVKPSGCLRKPISPSMQTQAPGTSKEKKSPSNSARKVRFEEQKITSPGPRTAEKTSDCNVNKPAKEANAQNVNVHAKEVKTLSANVPFKEIKTRNLNAEETTRKPSLTSPNSVHGQLVNEETTRKPSLTSPNSVHGQLVNEEVAPVAPAKDHRRVEMGSLLSGKKVQSEHMNVSKVINQAPCETLLSKRAPSISCSGRHPAIDAKLKDPDVEERESPHRSYFPSQKCIWKGGFMFYDTTTPRKSYGGFQAHPPCRVHRKAYNFSMTLPILLRVQLLPQSQVLEELFCDRYPGSDDIALYFAPDVNIEGSQKNYDDLLALLEIQCSAIRSYTDGVELLVFASTLLQEGVKDPIARSSTKGFLWGVFHCKKKDKFLSRELPSLVPPLESEQQDSVRIGEAEDMEIDMIGGKDLRGDERVVPRESTRKAYQPSNEERVENNLITSQDFDSSFHPAHLVSEQAQHTLSLLVSEISAKINTDSSSQDLLQNSLGKLSETVTEKDAPPGFEELTEHRDGDLQTYPISVVADTEEFEYIQQDFSHGLNGNGETYSIVHWRAPPRGWVKLNIVSKSKQNHTIAGGSGILRDESGRWIVGFTLNLGAKMGLATELWVLFWGLLLVWERGSSRKVVVESECRVLVECLQRSPDKSHPHKALIDSCIGVIQRKWDCRLTCIPREVNLCANCLAVGYEAQPLGRTILEKPPPNLAPLLDYDFLGIASPQWPHFQP